MLCLQVENDILNSDLLFGAQHANSFHLMEYWVVIPVNLVPSIHVPEYKESLQSSRQPLPLMGACVSPEQVVLVDVESIRGFSGNMILLNVQGIKIIINIYNGAEIRGDLNRKCSTSKVGPKKLTIFSFIMLRGWLAILSNFLSLSSMILGVILYKSDGFYAFIFYNCWSIDSCEKAKQQSLFSFDSTLVIIIDIIKQQSVLFIRQNMDKIVWDCSFNDQAERDTQGLHRFPKQKIKNTSSGKPHWIKQKTSLKKTILFNKSSQHLHKHYQSIKNPISHSHSNQNILNFPAKINSCRSINLPPFQNQLISTDSSRAFQRTPSHLNFVLPQNNYVKSFKQLTQIRNEQIAQKTENTKQKMEQNEVGTTKSKQNWRPFQQNLCLPIKQPSKTSLITFSTKINARELQIQENIQKINPRRPVSNAPTPTFLLKKQTQQLLIKKKTTVEDLMDRGSLQMSINQSQNSLEMSRVIATHRQIQNSNGLLPLELTATVETSDGSYLPTCK